MGSRIVGRGAGKVGAAAVHPALSRVVQRVFGAPDWAEAEAIGPPVPSELTVWTRIGCGSLKPPVLTVRLPEAATRSQPPSSMLIWV